MIKNRYYLIVAILILLSYFIYKFYHIPFASFNEGELAESLFKDYARKDIDSGTSACYDIGGFSVCHFIFTNFFLEVFQFPIDDNKNQNSYSLNFSLKNGSLEFDKYEREYAIFATTSIEMDVFRNHSFGRSIILNSNSTLELVDSHRYFGYKGRISEYVIVDASGNPIIKSSQGDSEEEILIVKYEKKDANLLLVFRPRGSLAFQKEFDYMVIKEDD